MLQEVDSRKDYELIDSVCFICDCMEHGNAALFAKIQPHAGPVLLNVIKKAAADEDDINFDLLYSSVFGLGLIARKLPNGQFAQLAETLEVLRKTTQDMVAGKEADLDEDEKEKRHMLRDNSISCLGKIVLFQNNGSADMAALTNQFFTSLPITNDIDEAQDIHTTVFEQIIAGSPVVTGNTDLVKGAIERIKAFAEANVNDEDKDILGKKGKELLQ